MAHLQQGAQTLRTQGVTGKNACLSLLHAQHLALHWAPSQQALNHLYQRTNRKGRWRQAGETKVGPLGMLRNR